MNRIAAIALVSGVAGLACGRDYPDFIIHNAVVYTLAWDDPSRDGTPAANAPVENGRWVANSTAVAVTGGLVSFVGSDGEVLALAGSDTQVLDAGGHYLVPGFVDSHAHPNELKPRALRVDLEGVLTEDEVLRRVTERVRETPPGEWVLGGGWDEGAWANQLPDKNRLSRATPDNPVILFSLHGFAAWSNQRALDETGITADTPDPVGGTIVRGSDGVPTGLFLNNATDVLKDAMPPKTLDDHVAEAAFGLETMARSGYTGLHHAGVYLDHHRAYLALDDSNALPIRVYGMIAATDTVLMDEVRQAGPTFDPGRRYQFRAVKAYYDGSLGVRGARLLDDYSDRPGHRGVSGADYGFDQERVADMMVAGFQVGIHAIGDAGNRETLEFFERVYAEHPEVRAHRNRVEHAQVVHPDDFSRFAALDLIASMEPPHMAEDKTWAEDRLGPERVRGAYAWRTFRQHGVGLTFNSDLTGSDYNIFYGLYAAVSRTSKDGEPAGGWYAAQAMTPEEALRAYTVWSARAGHLDAHVGTIEVGKYADFTLVDVDVLNVATPSALLAGTVLLTVVGGEVVYDGR